MLCDICHNKEAKIFYTEIVNGEKKESHLCEECAQEYTSSALKDKMGNEIPLGNILSGILSNYAKGLASKQATEPICGRCGMTVSELMSKGRLGCPECYNAFSKIIEKNFKTLQGGANEHHGKMPVNATKTVISRDEAEKEMFSPFDTKLSGLGFAEDKKKTASAAMPGNEEPAAGSSPAEESLAKLKTALSEAVAEEDYEEAARLRDLIHEREGRAGHSVSAADAKKNGEDKTDRPAVHRAKKETQGKTDRPEAQGAKKETQDKTDRPAVHGAKKETQGKTHRPTAHGNKNGLPGEAADSVKKRKSPDSKKEKDGE